MAEIFLSYRRQDSSSATGRLADRLEAVFGPQRVFRDHDSIAAGDDFAAAIRRAIDASTVLIVVIGRGWLDAALADGRRRLDDPQDWVRLEIEAAFDAGLGIVPVLVEGATMPAEAQLPASLAALARCQAVELSETRWRYDTDRLAQALQARFAIESQAALPGTAGAPAGALAGPLARLALDVLDLATHPTRLIARRQSGEALDHWRAFVFLLGSLLAGNVMLLVGTGVHPGGGGVAATIAWLASGELLGLLMVALLAVPMTLGWRLAGVPVEYRRVTLVGAYVYSGVWLGLSAGVLVMGLGLQFVDAGVFDRAVGLLLGHDTAGAAPADRAAAVGAQLGGSMHGPATALFAMASVVWAITAGWTVVAWGAFRQAFAATRLQAAVATGSGAALIATVVGAAVWLAA